MFCLIPELANKMKAAFRSGEIDFTKMADMESGARRVALENVIGTEEAKQVNLLIEKKLLLKNVELALVKLAQEVTGISREAKEASIAKLRQTLADKQERIFNPKENEQFLNELTADIYSRKYKTEVSLEEAQTITELSQDMKEAQNKGGIEFGAAKVALDNYVGALKEEANRPRLVSVREGGLGAIIENAKVSANFIAENTRSVVASLDNSFWGRQGIKTLLNPRTTGIWLKNFAQSFVDIAKTLRGSEVLDAVKAEIYSRENYRNGLYELGNKLDIGTGEEAFPTSMPSRIPVLGRLFKASEVAYEAGAMRLRADLADKFYKIAENSGIDLTDKVEVGSINKLVNSMTGRGEKLFGKSGDEFANKVFFSAKFFKSNLDFLTAHIFDDKMSTFAKKQAALNLVSVIGTTAIVLATAKALGADVEADPRSSDFGKIKIGATRFDITGGSAAIVTAAFRLAPLLIGQPSYTKSTTTGKLTKLNSGKYGAQTGKDVFNDFIEHKTAPLGSAVLHMLEGQNFAGKKATLTKEALGLLTPLIISTGLEAHQNKDAANLLLILIADGLGLNTTTYSPRKKS